MTYETSPWLLAVLTVYLGLCAGMIAQKHGKNPLLYGLLAVTPLVFIVVGIWAFSKFESEQSA